MNYSIFHRVLPFALFMACIGAEEALRFFASQGFIQLTPETFLYTYPIRVILAGAALFFAWSKYREINFRDLASPLKSIVSIVLGVAVFILWINMDWALPNQGTPRGFNPSTIPDTTVRNIMTAFRLAGAVMVVPIMEELFWRSFLVRYIIHKDFESVPVGLFTWPSFLISAALFGLEHHYVLAGIMAGIAYNVLLYYTKSIAHCILSHTITNLLLGIYVLQTGKWHFW